MGASKTDGVEVRNWSSFRAGMVSGTLSWWCASYRGAQLWRVSEHPAE